MAENADAKTSKSRFLSKSKWGKVFKENDAKDPAGASAAFSLNDDVIDFLKPSRDANAERPTTARPQLAPKLDIAIAQRWPSAHEVRLANSANTTTPVTKPLYDKPTRRPGLSVTFSKAPPDIIGEGGEESDEPTSEIFRRKILVSRSISERRPGPYDQVHGSRHASLSSPPLPGSGETIMPVQIRRVNTSYKELSPPLEKKHTSPPLPSLPPTHAMYDNGTLGGPSSLFSDLQHNRMHPAGDSSDRNQLKLSLPPTNDDNPSTARRQRIMRANEGMAFRRASALIMNGEDLSPEEIASGGLIQQSQDRSVPSVPVKAMAPFDNAAEPDDLHPGFAVAPGRNLPAPGPGFLTPNTTAQYRNVPPQYPEQQTMPAGPQSRSGQIPSYTTQKTSSQSGYDVGVPRRGASQQNPGFPYKENVFSADTSQGEQAFASNRKIYEASSFGPRNEAPPTIRPQYTAYTAPRRSEPADEQQGNMARAAQSHHPVVDSRLNGSGSHHPQNASVVVNTSYHAQMTTSPTSPPRGGSDSAAKAALQNFAGRVQHMKGVFKLTADKERSSDTCDSNEWLRSGLWWYLNAKLGLEAEITSRSQQNGQRQQLLTQAHVDLAKALWISDEQLQEMARSPASNGAVSPNRLLHGCTALEHALEHLALQMTTHDLMPPHQSLIQGQDIRLWLGYPSFAPLITSILSLPGDPDSAQINPHAADPLSILPLSDTSKMFCFSRFVVDAVLATDERETDRVSLPAICSILRARYDYQISIAIASQNNLINLVVEPGSARKDSLTWSRVSWEPTTYSLVLHLPKCYDLTLRMGEYDFKRLWNLAEHSRDIDERIRPQPGETLIHNAHLLELQYTGGAAGKPFPSNKLHNCRALVYEQTTPDGRRNRYNGLRLVLVTEPNHKSSVSAEHTICKTTPLYFEYLTDAAANGTTAMVIRFRDESPSCRALLVFADMASRQVFHDSLNGMGVARDEAIVCRGQLSSFDMEMPTLPRLSSSTHPALTNLQWQKIGVTNLVTEDENAQSFETVESQHLRLVIRHAAGTLTDRMNLSKGELLIRLPCGGSADIHVYREPQQDLSITVDSRNHPPQIADSMFDLLRQTRQAPSIRKFNFTNQTDMHAFQACITGYNVLFDGNATSFGISRRMMVVPIYHKWQASNVRIQVISQPGISKVLAFMDDFSHADAMCIQVKSMDVFETGKGDGKSKKWTVKLVDAKFSLPKHEKEKSDAMPEAVSEDGIRRRFVNLEGLEYAEEHDDITVGFETQAERDAFARALPAVTTVSRMITLKRRI